LSSFKNKRKVPPSYTHPNTRKSGARWGPRLVRWYKRARFTAVGMTSFVREIESAPLSCAIVGGKTMRIAKLFSLLVVFIGLGAAQTTQSADDATKKLGAFLGKWKTEGAFTSGQKTSTTLECRWSPMGEFLVCEQIVNMGGGEHRQFTVYSYDAKAGTYSYTTLADPGAKPTSGAVEIKGNLWTYNSSFENQGKKTLIRTTNEFTDAKTEIFKVMTSGDGGLTWTTMLEGKATKTGE
jgi:uncharacterized protein DUF1579